MMWTGTRRLTRACLFHLLLCSHGLVLAALNLDGTQAVEPATNDDDPSPIADPNTYYPDQHDCPLPCVQYANVHSWITYFSTDRLRRCDAPMLLQLPISKPLDKSKSSNAATLIRACTLASLSESAAKSGESVSPAGTPYASSMENPKTADNLVAVGIDTAPACAARGSQVSDQLTLSKSNGGSTKKSANGKDIARLLEGMQLYFEDEDNCDENFLFAYHKKTVAGLYIGPGLGKPTADSAIKTLARHFQSEAAGSITNRTVAELCSSQRGPERVFGIAIDTNGDLAGIQEAARGWRNGGCASTWDRDLESVGKLSGAEVFDIAGAPLNSTTLSTKTDDSSMVFHSRFRGESGERRASRAIRSRAATCRYIQVDFGDGCQSLVAKCGISAQDFVKFNPKAGLCGNLKENDYVCCSAGDPYTPSKPEAPKPQPDGTCATHVIKKGDTCDSLALKHGITVADIEKWNKGKTWAWTQCKDMLEEYNMCLSSGNAPLPPPQEGTQCGPLVPGTLQPSSSTPLADLNPCPLKSCCSNWGFCGVFPAHCDIHAPEGGGPGTKLADYQSTCVSNCGTAIKQNSGPPTSFGRIGYYESWNLGRDCLWLKAEDANTDGSYTHMHWGFLDIDPNTWKPVIKDPHNQWQAFKKLQNMKRIVSLGGWAYSTEPATYNIIRRAIIDNRDKFAANLAQFAVDEGIDGIDIDWEYPGAPDILVDGQPIGKKTDGLDYLKFLTVLKQKVGKDKSVSIAAPASFWYLKAFPIDRIASMIDYIVYMTYDLHGQWDYGNPNAFDQCDSGKCIRSHVNITETRNALGMITKAGVPNNKIFVGESSYGRSFRMAQNGCWGPLCDFTGTRLVSNANPGRCTGTGGYLANAEIEEILKRAGTGARMFRDTTSDSDIMLYKGDYVSYMTPATKETRRKAWQGLNFAGSIDWAVDLQFFGDADVTDTIGQVDEGQGNGCVSGEDVTLDSGDLCEFSCSLGFCPEPLCICVSKGPLNKLPDKKDDTDIVAWDEFDVDLNRLCRFACKHGYCPTETCGKPEKPDPEPEDDPNGPKPHCIGNCIREQNKRNCLVYKGRGPPNDWQCQRYCDPINKAAKEEDESRITSYGCVGIFPIDKEIPWEKGNNGQMVTGGQCECNNWLVHEIAEFVLEALPMIAQIGCYILMSSLKLVLDIGLAAFPAGRAIGAGLDMAATAAQTVSYIYDKDNDPAGAFEWWLSPCGGHNLVPDEIKDVFGTLQQVTDGISFKQPKKIKKGSGKKGDDGNPHEKDRGVKPGGGGVSKPKPKCRIPAAQVTKRMGPAKNTLRVQSCVGGSTVRNELIVTSLDYAAAAKPTPVTATCLKAWSQACYHYSSVISVNKQWATLTCPPEAASTAWRNDGDATATWSKQHSGAGWQDPKNRQQKACDRDEYPPAYMLGKSDPAFLNSGKDSTGQLVRWIPAEENRKAGKMWKGACFSPPIKAMSDAQLRNAISSNVNVANQKIVNSNKKGIKVNQVYGKATVNQRPEFSITSWGHSVNVGGNHGLSQNKCWPKAIAANDPGFVLLSYDPYYQGKQQSYNYAQPYKKGTNGS